MPNRPQSEGIRRIDKSAHGQNRLAALDLGTNSFHLIICQATPDGLVETLDTHKEVVRLGDGLDEAGFLSAGHMQKAVDCLKGMKKIIDTWKCPIRAVATHAIRAARNHGELLRAIEDATGIHVELIDGYEEARLGFLGMRSALPLDRDFALGADIGGGSTELIVACRNNFSFVSSLKIGTVGITNRFLKSPHPPLDDIRRARNYLTSRMAPLRSDAKRHPFKTAVATSGTAKALARMLHYLENDESIDDPNGNIITLEDLDRLEARLIQLAAPRQIRSAFDLDKRRSEIILAGCMILRCISEVFAVQQWVVATRGLREGLAIDTFIRRNQIKADDFENIRWKSVQAFADKTGVDKALANDLQRSALMVYDALEPFPGEDIGSGGINRELLGASCWLCECGKFVGYANYHKHAWYLITHGSLLGFSQEERSLIALVCRYSRKKVATSSSNTPKKYLSVNLSRINFLASCLRIARALNRTRSGGTRSVQGTLAGGKLQITIDFDSPTGPEAEWQALQKERKNLCKALGMAIEFRMNPV